MRSLHAAALVLLVIAVPIFLITTNLRIVINSGWLYSYGFDKYDVASDTCIDKPELMRIAREFKRYFSDDEERLNVRATVCGEERDLFKPKEIDHMVDVKGLVEGVWRLQGIAFWYMVAVAVIGALAIGRAATIRLLARGFLFGGLLTLGLLAALGVASIAGFDALFTQFHVISFSNDFWLLDPRTDYLVRIFPEGFFEDATLIIGGMTLAQALLTALVTGIYLRRARRVPARKGPVQEH